ncbi:hypothetical protein BT67DRAFT_106083 [Trichocladium antarcticum]|uniref:Uncharacterized protein n=1 Tax=Trichocladium antarcticum TaxID=1450529 RepID=A0AAN6UT16_9PEZI|nr:hypothetical protein BT67DRAFT_106083 [Trichocladium antarcticum]
MTPRAPSPELQQLKPPEYFVPVVRLLIDRVRLVGRGMVKGRLRAREQQSAMRCGTICRGLIARRINRTLSRLLPSFVEPQNPDNWGSIIQGDITTTMTLASWRLGVPLRKARAQAFPILYGSCFLMSTVWGIYAILGNDCLSSRKTICSPLITKFVWKFYAGSLLIRNCLVGSGCGFFVPLPRPS